MPAEWMECVSHQNVAASVVRANVTVAANATSDVVLSTILIQWRDQSKQWRPAAAAADGGGDATDVYLKGLLKKLLLRAGYFVLLHYY